MLYRKPTLPTLPDIILTPGLKDGLSIGSWLLLFLFIVIACYLGFGMAYNYNEVRHNFKYKIPIKFLRRCFLF